MGYQNSEKEKILKALGRNIDRLRVERGITMERMGEDLGGYDYHTILRWKNGRGAPRIATLYRIAKYFDVTIDSLFEGAEER